MQTKPKWPGNMADIYFHKFGINPHVDFHENGFYRCMTDDDRVTVAPLCSSTKQRQHEAGRFPS